MKTYFKDIEGVEFQTIMWTVSNIINDYLDNKGECIIKPFSPEPFKFWYVFTVGNKKICAIKRESELVKINGHLEPDEMKTWLEWYDDDNNFVDLNEEAYGDSPLRILYPGG